MCQQRRDVQPHVADYFRGERGDTRAQQYRKPIINDKCWSSVYPPGHRTLVTQTDLLAICSLHPGSIRLRGPKQQADAGLISDAIYRRERCLKE